MNTKSTELPPQYNPKDTEERIYRTWVESGYFNPDKRPKTKNGKLKNKNFSIAVPPPNITGSLHMGHALNATIQDILIRKKRMEGYKTLWLPGTDHAGIATQNVVEKELKKEGKSRLDLGRERFVARVWEWREKYGNIILDQFKKIGSSLDWSRTRFTMDPEYRDAVKKVFIHYYKKGWLYRSKRTINWCPRCATSLSDLEIEYQEEETKLYYIKYDIFTVATTRPETKLGDTALAVHPLDKRYKKYIGKEIKIQSVDSSVPANEAPKLKEISLKIIADKAVDPAFGTGVVKVTPAHDLADFEIYQRNPEIPVMQVIGEDGKMTHEAGTRYVGLKAKEAREKIAEDLALLGLIEKVEEYTHNTSVCYRCDTVLEPIFSTQWFMNMEKLSRLAAQAVKTGKVRFHPKRWEKVYLDWLKNTRDWCISRQIWWGHEIPVGYCVACGDVKLEPKIKGNWYFARHGETDWNIERRTQGSSDTSLNEKGRMQAQRVGLSLKERGIDLILSSPQKRAKETAEIIAAELGGVEIVTDAALRERNYGILEGLTLAEAEARGMFTFREQSLTGSGFTPEGGETVETLEARVREALLRHKKDHAHRNIAIVSHGGTLRTLIRVLRQLDVQSAKTMPPIHNAQVMHFGIAPRACSCGSDFIEKDENVLDTWFSSALWPLVTLGWPKQTKDFKTFYPTQTLSTARDIINLWVGRMVLSGTEFTKKAPFKDVIIHATILTKDGKRMSKSLGTGIDPLDLIERHGADAVRFGLIWQAMGNQDMHWSEEHVVAGKKFANKIWNAARFVLARLPDDSYQLPSGKPKTKTPADKKILAELSKVKKETSKHIERYEFGQALHRLHDFFWHAFCDRYLEASKDQMSDPRLAPATEFILLHVLSDSLKLLHPFMPFVTEEIWRHVPQKKKIPLMVEEWPK